MDKKRLDLALVELGHAQTRSQARQHIERGIVKINGETTNKVSQKVSCDDVIEITSDEIYVGRGALKIKKAVESFNISVKNKIIADIGASTGGFTDYLLQKGAAKSFCIDVGHDQLAEKLLNDPRVVNLEGTNVKNPFEISETADLCVVDLSFISLKLIMNNLKNITHDDADFLILFKPQFETNDKKYLKKGVIKEPKVYHQLLKEFATWLSENQFYPQGLIKSPIQGKDGNTEFLFHIKLIETNFDIDKSLEELKL